MEVAAFDLGAAAARTLDVLRGVGLVDTFAAGGHHAGVGGDSDWSTVIVQIEGVGEGEGGRGREADVRGEDHT